MNFPAKAKLPRFLSYPLTAAEIQTHILAAASGYPTQYDFLNLGRSKSFGLTSTPVLTMRFLYQDIQFPGGTRGLSATMGYPLPRWHTSIHAVPRSNRAEIRTQLFEEGLVRLQAWLQTSWPATWFQRNHCLRISHHEEDHSMVFDEHNRSGF